MGARYKACFCVKSANYGIHETLVTVLSVCYMVDMNNHTYLNRPVQNVLLLILDISVIFRFELLETLHFFNDVDLCVVSGVQSQKKTLENLPKSFFSFSRKSPSRPA